METDTFIDYYRILDSDRYATTEELRRNYQRLVMSFHPDKVGCGQEDNFHLLQKAWSVLKDPTSRKQYDAKLTCYENDQLLLYDTVCLADMDFDSLENVYSYQCRCNGVYYLEASELSSPKVNISCNECSFSIQVNITR